MRIADIHAVDRPRERIAAEGPGALADRELVALVLRSGAPGKSALHLANDLLSRHGGVSGLSRATLEEIAQVVGLGIAKAAGLIAAFELGRRSGRVSPDGLRVLRGPQDLVDVIQPRLGGLSRETGVIAVMDGRHRIMRVVPVSSGAANRTLLPIREILHAVLRGDGAAFAVAHNHPSGDTRPSPADIQSTNDLVRAADAADLRFLDHVIVTETSWLSLREAGYLDGSVPSS